MSERAASIAVMMMTVQACVRPLRDYNSLTMYYNNFKIITIALELLRGDTVGIEKKVYSFRFEGQFSFSRSAM